MHRTRRVDGWLAIMVRCSPILRLLVRGVCVAWRAHWAASYSRNTALLVNSRLWIHALLWPDVTQLRIVGRLLEALCSPSRPREVADEVQVLSIVRGD